MRHLFSSPLGSCAPPCAPTFKCSGLGAIDALGGFIGGLFNLGATMDTNDMNAGIARMTQNEENWRTDATNKANKAVADEANRYNKLLQDEQNAWNLEQWNRENEYNSPSEVVKRLKAAGINPYTYATSGAGSTPASSLQSAQAKDAVVAQMQKPGMVSPPQMIAPQLDMPSMSQTRLLNAQADRLNADTQIAHAQEKRNSDIFPSQLEYAQKLAKEKGYLGDMARETLQYYQVSRKYDLAKLMGDVQAQADMHNQFVENKINTELNNQLLRIEAMYAPRMKEAELNQYRNVAQQIKATIALTNANKLLTDEQRLHEVEKKWNTIFDGELKGLDNQLKKDLYFNTIDMYRSQLEMQKFLERNQQTLTRVQMLGSVIPFASGFGQFYNGGR